MNQHNNPPFAYNQKIVRTGPSSDFLLKGKVYTAGKCDRCCHCGIWCVELLEFPMQPRPGQMIVMTCSCGKKSTSDSMYHGAFAKYFAPIITKRDHAKAEIEQSILTLIPTTEERSDVKKKEVAV